MKKPHFIIKNKFQKRRELYSDILTPIILKDVCERVTGCRDYTYEFNDTGYNEGRLAIIKYKGRTNFISFSEDRVMGRNSSFQSFPTALVRYHQEENKNKKIFFYFLPSSGNYETPYFKFIYRLMKTAGVEFLNEDDFLTSRIHFFTAVDDIITSRDMNRGRNRSNQSTYLTRGSDNTIQIYGKTYGASKYETTLLCLALSKIATTGIELYEIREGNLRILPAPAREVINNLGTIKIISTDLTMERREFEENDSLRSPRYIFNILERLGPKKCSFCNCEIPQLVEGAHIWPVADIKRESNLSQAQKLEKAIDGNNGIWLCQNHHKLLDFHILTISNEGELKIQSNLDEISSDFIKDITTTNQIPDTVLTSQFVGYLEKRNRAFQDSHYQILI
ncbi:MAG: HNH endonuclease signature motif containing protein [Nanoarchaeota archaeon]|nr:HNH endonuclease signature motif containing protein [Nanoarchaeota archaeon]